MADYRSYIGGNRDIAGVGIENVCGS